MDKSRHSDCPVHTLINRHREQIYGKEIHPRTLRIAEEILVLMEDIAWGRAGNEHIPSIESLSQELKDLKTDEKAIEIGQMIQNGIESSYEVFVSHVQTRNCVTGDCIRLTPAPCQMACPAGIDIPSYVTLIGMGKDAEAIQIIRRDNPFPWVCGLVCTRPCEFMCVRGRIDKPVSIKFMKAFAAERAMSERRYANPPKEADNGKKVCVIGAGPAGMSAAYYLVLKGYDVSVFESLPVAGGMIRVGIPRYRLPDEVIDREVGMLEDLGVKFIFNTRFGKDITIEQLRSEGFEAFFFAIGAHSSFKLDIPGENDYPQVAEAIGFLKRVALGDHRLPAKKAVIVGGGNVAIDAARTCLRLGCHEVVMAYRRTRDEMPADAEEVEQAEEEGIHFSFLTIPIEVVGENGKVSGLRCLKAKLVETEGSTRKSPVPIEGSDYIIEADMIISAIGQKVEQKSLTDISGLKWSRRGTIDINRISMETSIPGIFAAGDAVTGPATVIEAIGGGKRAADAIDRYLSGIPQPKIPPVPVRHESVECLSVPAGTKMILQRPEMPLLNLDRRRTIFQQVELGYSENEVREEARRCLRCDICRRCGECVKVCRDKMGINALQLGYLDFDHPVQTDFRKTEEKCICCGSCANNCPNHAMKIEDVRDERILSLCGTILNRQKLLRCEKCGVAMGSAEYLNYIAEKTQNIAQTTDQRRLCNKCLREHKSSSDVFPGIG